MTQIQHDNGEAYLRVPHSLDLRLTPYRHNAADAAALVSRRREQWAMRAADGLLLAPVLPGVHHANPQAEVSNDPEIARWSFSRPYPYVPILSLA
jgi:hypothetical protein